MKKIISLLFVSTLLLTSCSSDDDDTPDPVAEVEATFTLDATGTVAEQTAEQAKKTINGSWRVGTSSSKSSSKGLNCTFIGIEFTEDRFAIAIEFPADQGEAIGYGTYNMVEDANGNVSSVQLIDGGDIIATLTNIVVTETANELNATFDVVFNIPADYEWPCGDSLSGNYAADKNEPVSGAEDAEADSTLSKLAQTWVLTGYSDSDGGTLEDSYNEPCLIQADEIAEEQIEYAQASGQFDGLDETEIENLMYEIEQEAIAYVTSSGCEAAARIEVSFSVYGSYIFTFLDQDGGVMFVFVDSWNFTDSGETAIQVNEYLVLNIVQLTDTTLSLTSTDEDGVSSDYSFSAAN